MSKNKLIRLLKHLKADSSENKDMILCGLAIGIADVVVTLGDIIWLFGDMSVETHPHHYIVGSLLIPGVIGMIASFIWLLRAMAKRAKAKANKAIKLHKRYQHHNNNNSHARSFYHVNKIKKEISPIQCVGSD